MNNDIKVVARAAGVLTEESLLVGLIDGSLELVDFVPELTANVNVGSLGAHTETNNKGTFDKFMRVMSHDFTVFAGAWLGFISIDY